MPRVAPEPEELEVATDSRESIDAKSRALTPAATAARLAVIGVVMLIVAVAFAAVGG